MLEVRLLGQFSVVLDGKSLTIPTRHAQSLFAYLVLNIGKAHRREKLAGFLWPDSSEENARSYLSHELWRLRKVFDRKVESYFKADELTISFQPQNEYLLDVQKLENLPPNQSTVDDLMMALSYYQGELLPGFYDEWVSVERKRMEALFETKIGRLLEILQAEERWEEVFDWGMRWIGLGQWPEPAYRALMLAYTNTGDVSKAIITYERLSLGLQNELGVKPSNQSKLLYERIKSGKGVDAPHTSSNEKIQPEKSPVQASRPYALPKVQRDHLPTPLTSFIGREKEIRQVKSLISQSRLVTITGPGGVGKTRLAIEAVRSILSQFRDGIWWIGLGSLPQTIKQESKEYPVEVAESRKVGTVIQATAQALRVAELPGQSLLEGIFEYLEGKQLLLLFDNCEHLIEECAELVETLLAECPEVTILSTSREALGVPGERAWLLPSLSLPGQNPQVDIGCAYQSEAVCLFIERVKDVLPGYQMRNDDAATIAQICVRLDGIPMAIELAAARMNLLSAQEINSRLDRMFNLLTGGRRTSLPRQQTLKATIEWSYDLLREEEKVLFRRLAIFAGSFTLEAAEAICVSKDNEVDQILPILGRLIDKSLLKVELYPKTTGLSTRYRILDTIRSFGCLKLDEAREVDWLHEQIDNYYVHFGEAAEIELLLQNQIRWQHLFRLEHDNIRAVMEWSIESNKAESSLRLAGALLWPWYLTGHIRDGLEITMKALSTPTGRQRDRVRGRALHTAGFFQLLSGDTLQARQSFEEALTIFRESNEIISLVISLQFMGLVLANEQENELADRAFQESQALTNELMEVNTNSYMFFLGDVEIKKGDYSNAKRIYEESTRHFRIVGNKSFLAYPLRRLGYLALAQDDIPSARNYFQESLNLNREMGDIPGITASLLSMAVIAIRMNKPIEATHLFAVVVNRLESLSVFLLNADQTELRRIRNELPAYLEESAFSAAFAEGWEMNEDQAIVLTQKIFA